MKESFTATSYEFYHWSSRKSGSKSNLLIKGESGAKCHIWFELDPQAELQKAKRHGAKHFAFYFYQWQFEQILDMLRNEKPISVEFDDDQRLQCRL
ncbi:MAG: hypothetical protein SH818_04055 [Saprospiraceae bacterium]|nr:hypothetical protein [Saprospiraceae bacterium]